MRTVWVRSHQLLIGIDSGLVIFLIEIIVSNLDAAIPFSMQSEKAFEAMIEAKRLLTFLEWFLPIDVELIPDNSILREFVGNSMLSDFQIWQNRPIL